MYTIIIDEAEACLSILHYIEAFVLSRVQNVLLQCTDRHTNCKTSD